MHDFDALFGAKASSIIAKYPQKRSAVMPLLHLVQEHDHHISREAIEWIARKLDLQPINVYELVTFYPSFKEAPMGKTNLRICKTLSCMIQGAQKTGDALEKALNCKIGETRADGEVSIEWVECLACCDKAPVVLVGETLHAGVKADKVPDFLQKAQLSALTGSSQSQKD